MSHFLPKRLSELTANDDFDETPIKTKRDMQRSGSILPKRLVELESVESEEESEGVGDSLNDARLNDSFVLSPTSKDFDPTPVKQKPPKQDQEAENDQNENNVTLLSVEILTSSLQTLTVKPSDSQLKKISPRNYRPIVPPEKPVQPKMSYQKNNVLRDAGTNKVGHLRSSSHSPKGNDHEVNKQATKSDEIFRALSRPNVFKESDQSSKKLLKTDVGALRSFHSEPVNKVIEADLLKISQCSETPLKVKESNLFVTPSLKARPLSSLKTQQTTARKAFQTIDSRKILFSTPMSNARPVISVPTNDSISLSLDDTPDKPKKPLSPINELRTSKRSTDALFPESPLDKPRVSEETILRINNGNYGLLQKIGCGGSSSVFFAKDKTNNRDCAVKLVNLDGDPAVIAGYLNETKLLAKLQGNINVVALYDYQHVPEKRQLIMVMEKGDSDLHKILQNYKDYIPLHQLMRFWYEMLQCVNYIHKNGVIHSDLKPANFLMINGRLKLIDFGIASNIAVDSTSIIKFSQAGTFNYISPESLTDTSSEGSPATTNNYQPKIKISTKSDVWSLGCILYLLLYKKTPFAHIKNVNKKMIAITNPHVEIEYPKLPSYYLPVLVDMLRRCLRYNPKERCSVADLLRFPFDMVIPLKE